jgi:succinate dehydrogenase/fumarate reductase flavoprotein subunit
VVFGRIAGKTAGEFVKNEAKDGKLSVEHVAKYHQELETAGVGLDRVAPMLLPDYTPDEVKEKQWTATYEGTLR